CVAGFQTRRRATSYASPIWKSATQQVWKLALRQELAARNFKRCDSSHARPARTLRVTDSRSAWLRLSPRAFIRGLNSLFTPPLPSPALAPKPAVPRAPPRGEQDALRRPRRHGLDNPGNALVPARRAIRMRLFTLGFCAGLLLTLGAAAQPLRIVTWQ